MLAFRQTFVYSNYRKEHSKSCVAEISICPRFELFKLPTLSDIRLSMNQLSSIK